MAQSEYQLDLFRREYHAAFIERDYGQYHNPGYRSPILYADTLNELRGVIAAKLKRDGDKIAYVMVCRYDGKRVQKIATVQRNPGGVWQYE